MTDFEKSSIDIKLYLKKWFLGAERVVLVGIGNPFRRDDFVGVELVRNLRNKVSESVCLIEAESVPENYLEQIINFSPTHILLIDAGLINMEPGSQKLADPSFIIRKTSLSTHTLPLRVFYDYLMKTTNAKIGLLIIQPKDTSFAEGLTPILQQSVNELTKLLHQLLP